MDAPSNNSDLLRVEQLTKHFPIYGGILRREIDRIHAVDGVSFSIPQGQTFGLVWESGCGKTTLGKSILRITNPTSGKVKFDGRDITELSRREFKGVKRDMQMVFQDPSSSLNPRRRAGDIVKEPMVIHDWGTEKERKQRIEELFDLVGMPLEYKYKYPSQLSGGQKQRVGIARAIALNPKFLVLDEPTSSLDVSVQARIVHLLNAIQEELDLTYLFISHDLSLVKNVADLIGVMYLGRIVEIGRTEDIFRSPEHPYTRALLSALSPLTEDDERYIPRDANAEGEIPDPRDKPSGCAFRTRCPQAFGPCDGDEPPLFDMGDEHFSRCYLHDEGHNPEGIPW
jgi:oligopeptide transport system ATP-binding protein